MNVLICPDKFKGSLTAPAAARAIARAVRTALPHARVVIQPLADGGEGSLELLAHRGGLRRRRLEVSGPLRRPLQAEYLLGDGRAVIESAAACGLHLVPPHRRHPRNTTTIGVGMLLDDALSRGAKTITLLLGGSATNDCGAGMAAALGYRFLTKTGLDFVPMADSLSAVDRIVATGRHPGLVEAHVTTLCDVTNPLTGPAGASLTYAEQKGASPDELKALDLQHEHFAELLRRDLGRDVAALPGAGAAGGLGAGAAAFLGATIRPGTEGLFEAVGFRELARRADLIITGEGKIDAQTRYGKVVAGVLRVGKPTLAVCGSCTTDPEMLGAVEVLALDRAYDRPTEVLMRDADALLERMVHDYLKERQLPKSAG